TGSIFNIRGLERWMNQKHETGFPQPFSTWQSLSGSPVARKCLFQINLAASSGITRNAFGHDCVDNAIPAPALCELLRFHKAIVFVVGVAELRPGHCYPQTTHTG